MKARSCRRLLYPPHKAELGFLGYLRLLLIKDGQTFLLKCSIVKLFQLHIALSLSSLELSWLFLAGKLGLLEVSLHLFRLAKHAEYSLGTWRIQLEAQTEVSGCL